MTNILKDGVYGEPSEHLRSAFLAGNCPVAVYGLGKMGLPLASVFADVCGNVVGIDIDSRVVEAVNDGICPIKNEPGLDKLVAETVEDNALEATTDTIEAARNASIHVVIVPTPITENNEPDLSTLDSVIAEIARGLDLGDMVLVECTVPPRTCSDRVVSTLVAESGLEMGDFGVAYCPERTSSGRALDDIRGAYPKVVGGVDNESTRAARVIYEEINRNEVIEVSDATTAECVKVFEGLYRDVNIALANELAMFTEEFGIDVREAIAVANSQPFCDIHDPGPGVGGHCIPFYPYFVIKPFETEAPILETAREVNDMMPHFTVDKLRDEFEAEGLELQDSSVLILGLTYRPGIEEIRASPSLTIADELTAAGVDVYGVDPLLDSYDDFALEGLESSDVYEYDFDGIVLVTKHTEFEDLDWEALGRDDGAVVIDGRDSLCLDGTRHRVYTIGSGYNV